VIQRREEAIEMSLDLTLDVGVLTKRTLHSHEMDALLRELAWASEVAGTLTIDLSGITYATPSGMVWLLAALRGLQRIRTAALGSHPVLRVIAPSLENPRVRLHYWFNWMGFYDFLDAEGIPCERKHPETPLAPAEERSLKSETLLVLTTLRSSADVARVVGHVSGTVASLLKSHLDYDTSDVANLSIILSEACHNIIDHAGAGACGLVAAQVMRRPKQEPFVMIGVVDDGMGIRRSLEPAHPEASQWSDEEAIHKSLQLGFSGVPNADRGLGLWSIVENIPKYRGTLHVRSGAARVRIKANESGGDDRKAYLSAASLPGTMLCLTLRKRIS
jgi:anti-sigma regulatory factor (Ser/Thr protein kinase)